MKRSACLLFALSVRASATEPPPPTWAHDIAPILYHNCVECHRPGQVGPFSLLTYETAAKKARDLSRAVNARYMPPWLPEGMRSISL